MHRSAIRHNSVLVFGGQAGSEGKGKVCADIALNGLPGWKPPTMAVCCFMTNAGHTAIVDGKKVVVQQLPIAAVNPTTRLFVGPGAAITLSQLDAEIRMFDELGWSVRNRLFIHPRAVMIDQRHRDIESEITKRVASTMKGCGAALADKALRHPSVTLAQDIPQLGEFMADTTGMILKGLAEGGRLLIEGSQGFDLDVNHGLEYPNCTSRMANPSAILADCGLPLRVDPYIIAVVRTHPIRVGNVVEDGKTVGYSGGYPSTETSWPKVAEEGGWPVDSILERTTVTKRVRRVFEFSETQFDSMLSKTRPDGIALMFADYLAYDIHGAQFPSSIDKAIAKNAKVAGFFDRVAFIMRKYETGFTHIGTGPALEDMIRFVEVVNSIPLTQPI